jgi:alkanesulfonate monooxygenase SsuD/methylene tetrahydromethanopterin reductase-like flavin-dependent oxidoreductase (luciferase family)
MKVHLRVDCSPAKVRDSARQIADLGADGMFSFEGQHDVFFPPDAAQLQSRPQPVRAAARADGCVGAHTYGVVGTPDECAAQI